MSPANGQLPTVFQPGIYSRVVSVLFDGSKLTWTLTSNSGTRKTAVASVASSLSSRCKKSSGLASLLERDPAAGADLIQPLQIVAYPNPVSDRLFLNLGDDQETRITLFDILGRVCVPERKVDGNSLQELNLTGFKAGVYLLRIQSGEKIRQIRVVKK